MGKIIISLFILLACCIEVKAETYKQCRNDVLKGIARQDERSRKKTSREDKRLAVKLYCEHLRKASSPEPRPRRTTDRIDVSRRAW